MLAPFKVSADALAVPVPAPGIAVASAPSAGIGGAARAALAPLRRLDARVFQILFLGTLLLFGALVRDFALQPEQVVLALAAGLGAQAFWIKALGLKNVGYLSALVTCLGTSILVRADSLWVHPLLAALAMSAKFTIRIRGKHLYNPANLAVILAIAVVPGAWASPGQWGSDVLIGLWFVCLGVTVTTSAKRLDIAWAFLGSYTAMLAARMLILGQPHAVLIHQLGSGALLLFTFFMISDPMTTPNRRALRLTYAFLVAALAFVWQFFLFIPNGPVWALFLLTPLVPLIDWIWPGKKHIWQTQARLAESKAAGELAPSRRALRGQKPA
jgi:Na+-transporting NADH:ubiquinone oxidoreductase subunit NqrB